MQTAAALGPRLGQARQPVPRAVGIAQFLMDTQFPDQDAREVDAELRARPGRRHRRLDPRPDRRGGAAEQHVQRRQVVTGQVLPAELPVDQRARVAGAEQDVGRQKVAVAEVAPVTAPGQQPQQRLPVGHGEEAAAVVPVDPLLVVHHRAPGRRPGHRRLPRADRLRGRDDRGDIARVQRTGQVTALVGGPVPDPFEDQRGPAVRPLQLRNLDRGPFPHEGPVDVDLVPPLRHPERIGGEQDLGDDGLAIQLARHQHRLAGTAHDLGMSKPGLGRDRRQQGVRSALRHPVTFTRASLTAFTDGLHWSIHGRPSPYARPGDRVRARNQACTSGPRPGRRRSGPG